MTTDAGGSAGDVKLTASFDSTGIASGATSGKQSLRGLKDAAKEVGEATVTAMTTAGAASEAGATKIDNATKRAAESIQRTIARVEAAGKGQAAYLEQLASFRGADVNALRPLLDQLAEVEARQKKATVAAAGFANGTDAAAKSAQQLAFQLRAVGPQFTDIVTSLASGQAPLTVLIQQGGQLKDVFGGIGPAARALGTYLLGLVNPYTVAAAAIAGIGFAYFQGAKEEKEFTKAILLSGNAAGVTAGQLGQMAVNLKSITGSQGAAADALAQFARAGDVGRENLERFTASALLFEKTTGQAVKETVKQFEELKKAPLEASVKLNEATGYLTASVYSQIKALEEQGKKAEAAAVAQRALSDANDKISKTLQDNAGSVERAWDSVVKVFDKVLSAITSIGKATPAADLSKQLESQIKALEAQQVGLVNGKAGAFGAFQGDPRQLNALKEQLDNVRQIAAAEAMAAASRADQARQVKALEQFDKQGLEVATKRQKMEKEIADARNLGLAAGKSQEEIEKRILLIRDKYKESPGPKDNSAARELEAQRKAVAEALGVTADYVEVLGRYQKARDAGTLSEEAYTKAILELIAKQPASRDLTKQQADAAKELERAQKDRFDTAKRINTLEEQSLKVGQQSAAALEAEIAQQRRANEEIGLTAGALQLLRLARMDDQIVQAESTLIAAKSNDIGDEKIAQMEREIALLRERRALVATGDADRAKADFDREFIKAQVDGAQRVADEWQRAADSINQGLTDSLFRAAESGKDFFESLAASAKGIFNNLVLKPIIQSGISSVGQAAQSALTSAGATGTGSVLGNVSSLISGGSTVSGWLGGGTAAAGWGSSAGVLASSTAGELGFSAATSAAAAGSGGLSAALAAIPVWGWALLAAAAIAAVVGQERGGPKLGGSATTGADGARLFTPDAADAQARQVLNSILTANAGIAGKFGGKFSGTASIGFDQDPQGKADSRIASIVRDATGRALLDNSAGRDVGRDPKEFDAQLQVESKRVLLAALQASDLQNGFDEIFKRLDPAQAAPEAIDSLFNLAEQLRGLGEAAKDLPGVMGSVASLSATAREQLVGFAGGLEQLAAQQSSYFAEFFSEQEQLDNASRVLTGRFSEIGLSFQALQANAAGPRAAFRSLVEGLDLTTESGRQSYAALIALAAPLDAYLDGLAKVSTATQEAGQWFELLQTPLEQMGPTAAESAQAMTAAAIATAQLTARVTGLEQSIAAGESELADLQAGISAVFKPAETAGQRLVRMAGELDSLSASLAAITNPGGTGGLARLQSLIAAQDQLQSARAGIGSAIDEQTLQGFQARGDTAGAVAFLQALEGRLWSGLADSADKGAAAGRIQSVFLQRIGLEAGAAQKSAEEAARVAVADAQKVIDLERASREQRIKGLEDEIRAAEQFAGIAESLRRTVADLKFSDLSPLNPQDQLNAAKAEFERVLSLAQGGDLTALQSVGGVGTSLIQEQRSFGASTSATADVFRQVTDALDALGVGLGTGDVTDAQRQLDELRAIKDPIVTLTAATVDYSGKAIEGLRAIDTALAAGTDYLGVAITDAIDELKAEVVRQTAARREDAEAAQLRANALATELERLRVELAAIKDNTGGTRSAVQATAAAPEVVA